MENNSKPYFDPYILNTNSQNYDTNNKTYNIPSLEELQKAGTTLPNISKYYEEQYIYFRYLSQVVDYKTRLFEYEKLTNSNPSIKNNNSPK